MVPCHFESMVLGLWSEWRYSLCNYLLRVVFMKTGIHPNYETVTVTCSCGHSFQTRSTLCKDLSIEVCANCHPFYTGKQKLVDTGGRVQKFRDRYKARSANQADS